MSETELWSTLVTAIDPGSIKAMPAVLQSTIELLETELVKARAALQEIQPNAAATAIQRDELATGVMAAYRQQLIGRAPDFYGSRRLSPKEIGLEPVVQEVASDSDDNDDCVEQQQQCTITVMPLPRKASLVHALSNNLILDHMAPYLSVSSLLALTSTSRFLRSMILETPYVFRHLDLTRCHGAQTPGVVLPGTMNETLNDNESLTEDEFYAAPLKGIFDNLAQRSILQDVRTLVLDGLPVPADLVADIVLTDRFNVNILSIRDCRHLNERKLMQILQYAVRPTRPQGTPRVKGIYHFTPVDHPNRAPVRPRYRDWWNSRSQTPSSTPPSTVEELASETTQLQQQNDWYLPSGQILKQSIDEEWAKTIKKCEGIIAFDAVLCRGPRHNIDLLSSANQNGPPPEGRLLGPALATVALGPQGCDGCHTSPEGPAIWGQSDLEHFPLLSPIPHHSSSLTAAKRPVQCPGEQPILIARCTECLTNRWCHRCNKWFCSSCLPEPVRITTNLSPHQTAVHQRPRNNENGAIPEQVCDISYTVSCYAFLLLKSITDESRIGA